jgi:hypothetical protein
MKQVKALVRNQVRYVRRSRLFLFFAGMILIYFATSTLPWFFVQSASDHFRILKRVISSLTTSIYFLVVILGFMTVRKPLKDRTLKLIVTKPCSLWQWLTAIFVFGIGVGGLLYLGVALLGLVFFLVNGIPVQIGMFAVIAVSFARSVLVFSLAVLLTSFLHPLIAAGILLFANQSLLYQMLQWSRLGMEWMESGVAQFGLGGLYYGVRVTYLLIPSFAPFSSQLGDLMKSFRLQSGDLFTLGMVFLYTALIMVFSLATTSVILDYRDLT